MVCAERNRSRVSVDLSQLHEAIDAVEYFFGGYVDLESARSTIQRDYAAALVNGATSTGVDSAGREKAACESRR